MRRGRALLGAVSLFALCGCALSFEDAAGRRHVVGLYVTAEDASHEDTALTDVRHFAFYGLWLDEAFRGTSLAFGEVELSVASLRNQWRESDERMDADSGCDDGFGFHWCTLGAPRVERAGGAFDIAVAVLTIGAGTRDRHLGIGYHRQVLLEVTNANALVAWPAHVGLEGLLRGSYNG